MLAVFLKFLTCVSQILAMASINDYDFLIYINDLPEHIVGGRSFIYADDTAVVLSAATSDGLQSRLSDTFRQIDDWCLRNQVILNLNKTICVEFRNRFNLSPLNLKYCYGHTQIETADRATSLGVVFDSLLDFSLQIDSVCSRLNKLVYLFLKLRNTLTIQQLLTVYYGMVQSVISYNEVI